MAFIDEYDKKEPKEISTGFSDLDDAISMNTNPRARWSKFFEDVIGRKISFMNLVLDILGKDLLSGNIKELCQKVEGHINPIVVDGYNRGIKLEVLYGRKDERRMYYATLERSLELTHKDSEARIAHHQGSIRKLKQYGMM